MENKFSDIIECINSNSLIGIKAGTERQTFLSVWMVVVDNRIFARSWGFAEKSWYNTFLQDPSGEIKCGDRVVKIRAKPIINDTRLAGKISNAYLEKYNKGENAFYAQGIVKPDHAEKTMEFIVISDAIQS